MNGNNVLFDASRPTYPLVGEGSIILLLFVVIAIAIIRYPKLGGWRRDPTVNRAVAVFVLLFASASLIGSISPFFLGVLAQHAQARGQVQIVEGCVRGYQRVVGAHDVADTYFSIGGTAFHFNSSPWLPGFRNEADVIRPDQGLKITKSNNIVIRVEVAPNACGAKG
ncbi:MAG TPA: hypothetical protein VG407_01705 [Caulobacteraceae bacterium]|nr:hypothetical protein [Caulobacteraceae bacterium]